MAKIRSIAVHLPNKIVTNKDLKKEFPKIDFKELENTVGVFSRHIADKNETALDLAEEACIKLFSEYDKDQIDFILFCTQTPDYLFPGNSGILQDRLKLNKNIGAFDFNLGCSGYVYGLGIANSLIESGMANNVLLVTSDTYSKHIHPEDKSNRVLFGDGAAATIIEKSSTGLGKFIFGTDGGGYNHLIVKNGGCRNKLKENPEKIEYGTGNITDNNHFTMNGLEVFSFTTKIVPKVLDQVLEKNQLLKDNIDHFVFHQPNLYMLKYLRKKANIPESKFYMNIENVGNTSSVTIPIALEELFNNNSIKPGQNIVLIGYGIGLSWAATVYHT